MKVSWILGLALLAGCASSPEVPEESVAEEPQEVTQTEPTEVETDKTAEYLAAAVDGEHRGEWRVRNEFRNPAETLSFFGLKSDMRVVEVWPGGGWYTSVLGPTLAQGGGKLVLAHNAVADGDPEAYRVKIRKALNEHLSTHAAVYGTAVEEGYLIPGERVELGEPGTADLVVTFRNLHGLARDGKGDDAAVMKAAFDALKPGGVLGVVQHRAPEEGDPIEWAKKGYLPETYVVQLAEKAGFVLDEKSEVNANPKDTKDHPEGVWTLPPSLRLGDQDREKYVAIGESDRMTLRFKKPQ